MCVCVGTNLSLDWIFFFFSSNHQKIIWYVNVNHFHTHIEKPLLLLHSCCIRWKMFLAKDVIRFGFDCSHSIFFFFFLFKFWSFFVSCTKWSPFILLDLSMCIDRYNNQSIISLWSNHHHHHHNHLNGQLQLTGIACKPENKNKSKFLISLFFVA